jgi:hypothetical protein
VLQKARAILSCIRYGQHFGTITSIVDPSAIINALIQRGRIGPHSEIPMQYAILVVENVARVTRDTKFSGRFNLEIVGTEENLKSLRLAADMLAVGEAIRDRGLDDGARTMLFASGTFKEPTTVRAEVARSRRAPKYSPGVLKRQIEQLIDDVRQVF